MQNISPCKTPLGVKHNFFLRERYKQDQKGTKLIIGICKFYSFSVEVHWLPAAKKVISWAETRWSPVFSRKTYIKGQLERQQWCRWKVQKLWGLNMLDVKLNKCGQRSRNFDNFRCSCLILAWLSCFIRIKLIACFSKCLDIYCFVRLYHTE